MLLCKDIFTKRSHTHDVPDVQRCGQGKNQTREQDGRRCPLKLSRLSIVKIFSPQLHKEENGEDHIDGREHHIVDDGLDRP